MVLFFFILVLFSPCGAKKEPTEIKEQKALSSRSEGSLLSE
jgi:hypothetical protein